MIALLQELTPWIESPTCLNPSFITSSRICHIQKVFVLSSLSKTWQNARESYPSLLCSESLFLGLGLQTVPITEIKHRSFMDMVDSSILKLHKRWVTLQEFTSDMILLYGCGSRIDHWLELATEMNVKELILLFEGNGNGATTYFQHYNLSQIIFGSKSLTFLLLRNCNMTNLLISTKCGSLQELILLGVYVTEDILQMIIFCCSSSLIRLDLSCCKLLKNLHISDVKKLKEVDVHDYAGELERIEIKAPSLGSFAYHGYRRTLNVCLASCVNVRELCIDCLLIPEQFTRDVGSRFPLLKKLELDGYGLKSFEISSLQLERLSLRSLYPIIIKAPNLSSFCI
ncbi:hypothetical protein RHMOL_Rhmol08G0035400 [Rhododendron molle]|uniref:Uncharacterized protein n=1 Tax=Rhododendron molle TaxID=49168 RepID=A0ACC0MJ60_RHOML|nr:hypothetical protein RHMOL_Rhmol08G0035400 [Rhododendron molle]